MNGFELISWTICEIIFEKLSNEDLISLAQTNRCNRLRIFPIIFQRVKIVPTMHPAMCDTARIHFIILHLRFLYFKSEIHRINAEIEYAQALVKKHTGTMKKFSNYRDNISSKYKKYDKMLAEAERQEKNLEMLNAAIKNYWT